MINQYMEVDKTKSFNKIKVIAILLWISYLIVYNTQLALYLPYVNYPEAYSKKNLTLRKGIVLIGGSNVRMGLSAEIISNQSYECINLGISGEYGDFSRYVNFFKDRITPEIIVYSSADIWSETLLKKNDILSFISIPNISIYKQFQSFFSPNQEIIFNSFGDQINYKCDTYILNHRIDCHKFTLSNDVNVQVFISRVQKLKKIFGTNKVIIRVPPIYSSFNEKKLIIETMQLRLKSLKDAGIIIIEGKLVSSDRSLFCYNNHLNEKGKNLFTMDLKASIKNLRLGY